MLSRNNARMQDVVPFGLESYRQFINWKAVRSPKSGKDDKVPCSPAGRAIDAHDPKNWVSADEASLSEFGIAFVFTARDPFFFIDIDSAWDGARWSDLASSVTAMFPGAAIEVSHSMTGLHIFGTGAGSIAANHRTKPRAGFPAGVEFYTHGRFVALTGHSKAGNALTDYSLILPRFVASHGLESDPGAPPTATAAADVPDPLYTGPADDAELLQAMEASRGGIAAQFKDIPRAWDLWTANEPVLARRWPAILRPDGCSFDRSAADAALMSHLAFWTGKHRSRMIRLFGQSALARPGHYAEAGGYRLGNILNIAIGKTTKVYDRPRAGLAPAASGAPGAYMQIAEQEIFFGGCVYIVDRHAVLTPHYGVLDAQRFRAVYGGHEFQMQPDGGRPTRNAFEAFTENRMHQYAKATRATFQPFAEPGAIIDGAVNTWRRPVYDDRPGDVSRFLNHLARLLPNHRDRKILLTYMQSLVQNPGVKFQWAPVIQGAEGNGKTLLIRAVAHAVTEPLSYNPKASQLTEKFNSWLEGKQFIGVEEIKIPDHRREMIEDLKEWITNDRVEIRHVGGAKSMASNYANWMLTTNHQDAVPITKNQRRFCMVFTGQQEVEDLARDGLTAEYFVDLYRWFNHDGGKQMIAHFLRTSLIDPEFDPAGLCQRAPSTDATALAISASLGRIEQEINEAIDDNLIGFRDGWISTHHLKIYLAHKNLPHVAPARLGSILRSLGYHNTGKASVMMSMEGRPYLWRKGRKDGTVAEYLVRNAL